jgi:putative aminopeptidase FrvX
MTLAHRACSAIAIAVLSASSTSLVHAAPDRTVDTLQKIADAAGPPGFEEPVRKVLVDMMKPLAGSLRYDGMGSIIATQGTSGPKIMVDAHMDELGGMVRRITPNGFLTMQMLGGWLDQALPDKRWVIIGSKGPVKAITGIRDIHVVPADERTKAYSRDSLYLDVGARNEAEVRALGLSPGAPIVPDAPFEIMNGSQNYLGKGWDDRVGCAVVVEAMRRLANEPHPNQISWVITTQEEIGLRGAHTASDVVKPDLGIALEGGITGDVFPGHPEETQVKLGAGPGIFLYDSSALPNRKLVAFTKQTAAERKLPLQFDLVQGYGDDSAEIQKSNGGVPTVNMIVPVRFTHSFNGIINRQDFDQTVDLLVAMLKKLDAAEVRRIRDFTPDSL